jgi:hypothetical protein
MHSPSPFTWNPGDGIRDALDRRIAALSFAGKPISKKLTFEECAANAALFVAAPAMLAELKLLAARIGEVHRDKPSTFLLWLQARLQDTIDRAEHV